MLIIPMFFYRYLLKTFLIGALNKMTREYELTGNTD